MIVRALTLTLALFAFSASANVGITTLAPSAAAIASDPPRGPVTVFYPTEAPEATFRRGEYQRPLATDGQPSIGNRRLVVISHGSGGSPWPHMDLAITLVRAGFIVAMPQHEGDNSRDSAKVGPESWKQRPAEVSYAIDRLIAEPRFSALFEPDHVGVYGMSAGGLTALTLAGARWSPAAFAKHCDAHIADDFPACVGLYSSLTGGLFDPLRIWGARKIVNMLFHDATVQQHTDARIKAAVAAVPSAAVIDPASMARPHIAVGLIQAGQDKWLAPRFHVDAIRAVCAPCETLAALPDAGHGSVLSPMVVGIKSKRELALLADPPEFERDQLPMLYQRVVSFFVRHLH